MLQSVHSTGLLPHGSLDCPCVDPYPLVGKGLNGTSCSGAMRGAECYPREYGSNGCRRYDGAVSPECQGPTQPAWCNRLWCFVAPWNCLKPNVQSKFFPGTHMANESLLAAGSAPMTDCNAMASMPRLLRVLDERQTRWCIPIRRVATLITSPTPRVYCKSCRQRRAEERFASRYPATKCLTSLPWDQIPRIMS